jgi:hypothetical protein
MPKRELSTGTGAASADDGISSERRSTAAGAKIVPEGGTFTPNARLDAKHGVSGRPRRHADHARERGWVVIETLIEQGMAPRIARARRTECHCALVDGGKITLKAATMNIVDPAREPRIPPGMDAAHRSDVEVLVDGLPEHVDLDGCARMMVDGSGDPPRATRILSADDPPDRTMSTRSVSHPVRGLNASASRSTWCAVACMPLIRGNVPPAWMDRSPHYSDGPGSLTGS